MDWFLLLSRMGKSYAPYALPQSCLSHTQRTQLAQVRDKTKEKGLATMVLDGCSVCKIYLYPSATAPDYTYHELY